MQNPCNSILSYATTHLVLNLFEFLHCIQTLITSLEAIGESTYLCEHLDIILEGLLKEYEPIIALICRNTASQSLIKTWQLWQTTASANPTLAPPTSDSDSFLGTHLQHPPTSLMFLLLRPMVIMSLKEVVVYVYAMGEESVVEGGRGSIQCQACHKFFHNVSTRYDCSRRHYSQTISPTPWPQQGRSQKKNSFSCRLFNLHGQVLPFPTWSYSASIPNSTTQPPSIPNSHTYISPYKFVPQLSMPTSIPVQHILKLSWLTLKVFLHLIVT